MKPRKPGRNIPEGERHTVRVPLRLPPEVADILRDQAEAQGIPVSGLIAELVLRTCVGDGRSGTRGPRGQRTE